MTSEQSPSAPASLVPVLKSTSRYTGEPLTPSTPVLGGPASCGIYLRAEAARMPTVGFFQGIRWSRLESRKDGWHQAGHPQKGLIALWKEWEFPIISIRLEKKETRKILSKCCNAQSQVGSYKRPWYLCYDTSLLLCARGWKQRSLYIATLGMM